MFLKLWRMLELQWEAQQYLKKLNIHGKTKSSDSFDLLPGLSDSFRLEPYCNMFSKFTINVGAILARSIPSSNLSDSPRDSPRTPREDHEVKVNKNTQPKQLRSATPTNQNIFYKPMGGRWPESDCASIAPSFVENRHCRYSVRISWSVTCA